MFWQEDPREEGFTVPRNVIDLSYQVRCRELPVDHAWDLRREIARELPWIEDEARSAIHSIHGASSGNGWVRPPTDAGSLLQLSRRTRLYLRVPASREADARRLCGRSLSLGEHRLEIGDCQARLMVPADTVFARSVAGDDVDDEEAFTRRLAAQLGERGIAVRKLLCGLRHLIHTPDGEIAARSVLLSDLEPAESVRLQEDGFGPGRTLGCGIFLPHKSLAAVGSRQEGA